ncbi:MAG: Rieske 2Fe-2S domain-containing protein [Candidatus Eremiobacteraeota bacterium]|nr:Rieske 2Fe-2S domain-containing protein [Candidatus Eremiobacteraeota bacterium]
MEPRGGSFGRNVLFDAMLQPTQDSETAERIAKTIQPLVSQALGDGRESKSLLANFLHGTWLGHPLHPVLTDVPIGAWMSAALLDCVAMVTKSERMLPAADFCVDAGVVSALVTAAAGLADWSQTYGRPARVGVIHATFNLLATTFYASASLTRRRNRRLGTLYSFTGFGLAMLGAGLGGHLVFSEQIGVNHAAAEEMPMQFEAVMRFDDLPENDPHTVQYGGRDVMLLRRGSTVNALLNTCAHLGGPLCEGTIDADSVRCPWHGSRFRLSDGLLLDGPATVNQPTFDVRVRDGNVELRSASASLP